MSRAAARTALGVGPEQVLVLTVARLAPQKNLGLVLDVAAALADRDDLRFAVAGDGPERAALAGRIAAQQLPVTLLGHRDDLGSLLAAADLALLTSTWEARALVAQEALLAGLPLVSTAVGGVPDLVGDAAVLFAPGDSAAAAKAVAAARRRPGRAGPAGRGRPAAGRHLADRGRRGRGPAHRVRAPRQAAERIPLWHQRVHGCTCEARHAQPICARPTGRFRSFPGRR